MTDLYAHQHEGIKFLTVHASAMLCDEMGLGKSRQALVSAWQLFRKQKINRVLILAPAAVRHAWREEIEKLSVVENGTTGAKFLPCIYSNNKQIVYGAPDSGNVTAWLPVLVLSYSLLPQARHVQALHKWCSGGKTLLVCDESSFLKSRVAKQTRGAIILSKQCCYRWLLTGTPVANSPLDLYAQALVMFPNGEK